MTAQPLDSIFSPKQIRFLGTWGRRKHTILSGAVSAGKTFISLWAFLMFLRKAPKTGQIIMIGRTLTTLNTNVMQLLMSEQIFGKLALQVRYTPGAKTATILGRTVHLYGASDANAETKIRGMTVAFAYVDEATLLPEGFWDMLITRLRVKGARLLATTNPGGQNHWLRSKWIKRPAATSTEHYTFTMDDNPSPEPEYIALQKAAFSGVFYDRFILGKWVAAAGVVYREFNEDKHLVPWAQLPPLERCLAVGIDYGTTNTTAGVLIALTKERKPRLVVLGAYGYNAAKNHGLTLPDVELSRLLREWVSDDDDDPKHHPGAFVTPEFWFLDPSAASLRTQLAADDQPTWKADNSVLNGIADVSNLLATDRIIFARETTYDLVDEITEYSWDERKQAIGIDEVLKENDHFMDALRYAVRSTRAVWAKPLGFALAA
ncbi:PBSX family phage terminase large subunit [Pseudomonas sp.]|uniref:PBSX family phage terminase large subunit n=1 Tax=Pseudomonas sp. TaxID=306 RepID=UPI002637230C|nr:PBSX family phage terminase large subunit [Pseudomonas sp.]